MSRFYSIILLVLSLLIQLSCSSNSFNGIIDGIEIGKRLRINLDQLSHHQQAKTELIEQVNSYFNSKIDLDSLRFYSAQTEINDSKSNVHIAMIPFNQGELNGTKLAMTILPNGQIERVRLWGNSLVNKDVNASFENFYRQFDRKTKLLPVNTIKTESEVEEYIKAINNNEAFLYRHKRIMLNKNYLIRHTMAATGQGKTPPMRWFHDQKAEFEEMAKEYQEIQKYIGKESASLYKEESEKATIGLDKMIQEIRSDNSASNARSLIKDYRKDFCISCHMIKSDQVSGSIKRLEYKKYELGYQADLFTVGVDLWAMPDQPALSIELARMVKAIVIYGSILKENNQL